MNLGRWMDRISIFVGEKVSIVFLVAVLLSAAEVILRYGMNRPQIWVHDSAITLSAIGFIFAGTYAHQAGRHIAITVIYDSLSQPVRRVFDIVIAIVAILFLSALLYGATRMALPSVRLMETTGRAWDVPIPALLKSLLVVGTALMLLQALVQLWRAIRGEPVAPPGAPPTKPPV